MIPLTPTPTPTPSPSVDRTSVAPTFRVEVAAAPAARMKASWRAGCPVPISSLRLMTLTHFGMDGEVHEGELIAHSDAVADLTRIFRKLFTARFPIERVELVDVYGADDDRSMAANNTSAFNCRRATDSRTRWSQHAYGRAIDINPIQNPYIASNDDVRPPAGRGYVDRRDVRPGMITRGDVVVRAFAAEGWTWGGNFRSVKDPQHFSSGGG